MSLNSKAASALRRELAKCFPERAPDDAGHARLADALTKPTHTPGDWESIAFGDGCVINGPDGLRVAMTYGRDGEGEERANADLIAAAPDLLEACKEAEECIRTGGHFADSNRTMEMLRAAIARATGGEG
jgi:hypothetical protein